MSSSQSIGSSSSTPEILPFLEQLAQFSQGLASQTYNWASGEFRKDSQLTDQNIQSYLSTSAAALKQAQNDTSRYDNLFQPQENNLITDANTFASQDRIKTEMGSAEAGVGQSMDANRKNAEQALQSFGVDPSSGRYDELEQAAAAQKGAAQAGAGQQAQLATEAKGRALRSEAIQVGERYPGQIINSLNTAMQGFSGAESARLGNTNTGANAFGTAAQFIKFPPVSNNSQSSQRSGSSSPGGGNSSPKSSSGQPGASSSAGRGAGGASPYPMGGGSGGSSSTYGDPNASGGGDPGMGNWGSDPNGFQVSDPSSFIPSQYQDYGPNAMPNPGSGDTYGSGGAYGSDPFNSSNDQGGSWGGMDPSQSAPSYSTDNAMPGGNSGWDQSGGGGYDTSGASYDTSGGSYDTSAPADYSYDSSGDYAQGGAVQPGQFAGAVSRGMSPSGGQQVDDVPMPVQGGGGAHLNADEFVIPQDVAKWKGQEFFQKLITQSRQARIGAPAKPSRGAPGQSQQQPSMGQ